MAHNLPATTDVAKQEQTLAALVKRYEANIVAALPTHVKPERVLSVIRTAVTSNPGLKECSPMSVIAGIVAASRLGLELEPALGQAYLVPRWSKNTKRMEATFQVGYRGKVELMQRANPGMIVQVRHVRDGDDFELIYEPKPKLTHKINARKPRGKVLCSYTYVEFPDGRVEVFEPMGIDEALDIRDRFAPRQRCPKCWGKRGQRENCEACKGTGETDEFTGPWLTDEDEMVRKTCLHRDSKWIPQSAELKYAEGIETRLGSGEAPEAVVLDLPAEDAENAGTAGATDARKEDLKQRLAEKTGKAPTQQDTPTTTLPAGDAGETGKPAQASGNDPREVPGSSHTDSAEGGGGKPAATASGAGTSAPASSPRTATAAKAVRIVEELPDPFEVQDKMLYLQTEQGHILYKVNEDETGWEKVNPQPEQPGPKPAAAAPQPAAAPQRGRSRRGAGPQDGFDYGGQ